MRRRVIALDDDSIADDITRDDAFTQYAARA